MVDMTNHIMMKEKHRLSHIIKSMNISMVVRKIMGIIINLIRSLSIIIKENMSIMRDIIIIRVIMRSLVRCPLKS